MADSQNNQGNPSSGGGSGGNSRRRNRYRGNRSGQGQGQNQSSGQGSGNTQQSRPPQQQSRPQSHGHGHNRNRRSNSRVLTSNQVLVKYDNLLEQHLITRRKYYEYFNRVDERQLYKLEKNFFDSIEHLRRFEANLEPWQREALEKRKTERYRLDLTYSQNRDIDPSSVKVEVSPAEIEDPHFKESQKEAFEEYKDDTEESEGSYEDYLRLKGLN